MNYDAVVCAGCSVSQHEECRVLKQDYQPRRTILCWLFCVSNSAVFSDSVPNAMYGLATMSPQYPRFSTRTCFSLNTRPVCGCAGVRVCTVDRQAGMPSGCQAKPSTHSWADVKPSQAHTLGRTLSHAHTHSLLGGEGRKTEGRRKGDGREKGARRKGDGREVLARIARFQPAAQRARVPYASYAAYA